MFREKHFVLCAEDVYEEGIVTILEMAVFIIEESRGIMGNGDTI